MLMHSQAARLPRRAPHLLPLPSEPGTELVEALGAIEGEWHVLLIGNGSVDVMCALLRAGASKVTHLRSHERLEAESASLAIVPRVASFEWLESALVSNRHAMIANGWVAVCVDAFPSTQTRVARLLKLHGFSAIRAERMAGRLLLTAEVPAFSLRRCA